MSCHTSAFSRQASRCSVVKTLGNCHIVLELRCHDIVCGSQEAYNVGFDMETGLIQTFSPRTGLE